jgi:hypothetical protein
MYSATCSITKKSSSGSSYKTFTTHQFFIFLFPLYILVVAEEDKEIFSLSKRVGS